MQVSEEPFLDRSEPNDNGSYDYWYQGSCITFVFDGGRLLQARRYADTPGEASVTFTPGGPREDDPETAQAVRWLRRAGVSTVKVLSVSDGTYRTIAEGRTESDEH